MFKAQKEKHRAKYTEIIKPITTQILEVYRHQQQLGFKLPKTGILDDEEKLIRKKKVIIICLNDSKRTSVFHYPPKT